MKAADWVLSQPWAITEEMLGTILAIAERRNESPEALEAKMGRPLDNTHAVTIRDGVAILPVVGPISRYADLFSEISGATAIETLARDFRSAIDNNAIRAVVLNMDSPGGTVAGVAEFAGHVAQSRGRKPVVAYVGSRAQSAGYWIASAADQVVADPTAMLGSIGVVMGMRARSGSSSTIEFVSSQSPYKRVDPATEAGKSLVQATADDLADVFVDAVAANRGVARERVLSDFGQGASLIGSKAVAAGMADGVGSLEHCIACLNRGEMPFPPKTKKPRAAIPAALPTRRAAMSEPIEGISAAEAAELRRQVAEGLRAKADAEEQARARVEAMEKDLAQLKVDRDEARAKAIRAEAVTFARDHSDKLTPVARDVFVDLYQALAADDTSGARVDLLKKAVAEIRPHGIAAEKMASNARVVAPKQLPAGVVAFAGDDGQDPSVLTEADKARLEKLARDNG